MAFFPHKWYTVLAETNTHKFLWFVFALSFIIKVLYFSQTHFIPAGDMAAYHTIAMNIATHQEFVDDQGFRSFRPPLYPFLVAQLYRFFGQDMINIAILQILLSCFSIFFVYYLTVSLFDNQTARLASLVFALYPDFIVYPSLLLSEVLFIFLVLSILMLSVRNRRPRLIRWTVLEGLLVGAAILTKPAFLIIYLVMILWLMIKAGETRTDLIKKAGIALSCAFLIVLPWTVRNHTLHHHFVLVDTNAGINAWIGNHPQATGEYNWPASDNPIDDPTLSEFERDRTGMRATLHFMRTHNGECLSLLAVKTIRFFQPIGEPLFIFTPGLWQGKLFFIFSTIAYGILALLGLAGMVYPLSRRDSVLVVYLLVTSILYILTVVAIRYRLPILPVLMIYAAAALLQAKKVIARLATFNFRSMTFHFCVTAEIIGIICLVISAADKYTGYFMKFLK
jgi:4-amino-4-deoxy-L-arabinose transferase-like glycosyltransferase